MARTRGICAPLTLLVGAYSAAALPAGAQMDPARLRGPSVRAALAPVASVGLVPQAHKVASWPLEGAGAAMRLKGGGQDGAGASPVGGGDQHRHAKLAEQLGLGSHAYVLPLVYSMLAGLSTGIGGLLCLPIRGNAAMEVPLTAFMLACAGAAMITVSIVDLFMHIAEEIGLNHTLMMSITGALAVVLTKKLGSALFGSSDGAKSDSPEDSEKKKSERRLLRVGLLTAVTLTAHNLPEGMAVAISTMGSVKLGLKLAVAIALHNIPEGLAIACPLIMSKRYSPAQAIGMALASGLRSLPPPLSISLSARLFSSLRLWPRASYPSDPSCTPSANLLAPSSRSSSCRTSSPRYTCACPRRPSDRRACSQSLAQAQSVPRVLTVVCVCVCVCVCVSLPHALLHTRARCPSRSLARSSGRSC